MPSNLGHLAPSPLARRNQDCKIACNLAPLPHLRRLVYLLETKIAIARLLGNLGRNLGLNGNLVGETKIARLPK